MISVILFCLLSVQSFSLSANHTEGAPSVSISITELESTPQENNLETEVEAKHPINWYKSIATLILFIALGTFLTWRFNKKPLPKIEFLTDWDHLTNDKK